MYTPTVYYLTSICHILAGIGFWGLHVLQTKQKNILSFLGTLLISITYFALAYFPIQAMNSDLSITEFIEQNLFYKIPGLLSLLGFILFSIAVFKKNQNGLDGLSLLGLLFLHGQWQSNFK